MKSSLAERSLGTFHLVFGSSYNCSNINFRTERSFVCGRNRVLAPLMKFPRSLAVFTLDGVGQFLYFNTWKRETFICIFEKTVALKSPQRTTLQIKLDTS